MLASFVVESGGKTMVITNVPIPKFQSSLTAQVVQHLQSIMPAGNTVYFQREMAKAMEKYGVKNTQEAIELEREMQEIKAAAIADGTFTKAPNGKPTNLDERQWIHVRTKNFKNWFGDWINDPENASRIVDENGEPLVVYHGSDANDKFWAFEKTDVPDGGHWFTSNPDMAAGYQENTILKNWDELPDIESFDELVKLLDELKPLGITYDIVTQDTTSIEREFAEKLAGYRSKKRRKKNPTEEEEREYKKERERAKNEAIQKQLEHRNGVGEERTIVVHLPKKYTNQIIYGEVGPIIFEETALTRQRKHSLVRKNALDTMQQALYFLDPRSVDHTKLKAVFLNMRNITEVDGQHQRWYEVYGQKTRDIVKNAFNRGVAFPISRTVLN